MKYIKNFIILLFSFLFISLNASAVTIGKAEYRGSTCSADNSSEILIPINNNKYKIEIYLSNFSITSQGLYVVNICNINVPVFVEGRKKLVAESIEFQGSAILDKDQATAGMINQISFAGNKKSRSQFALYEPYREDVDYSINFHDSVESFCASKTNLFIDNNIFAKIETSTYTVDKIIVTVRSQPCVEG